MSSPLIRLGIAAAMISLGALAGCTSADLNIVGSDSRELEVEDSTGGSDSRSEAHVMSESQILVEFDIQDEKVLAQNSHLSESIDMTAFTPKTGRVAIYSDCIGPGRLTIALGDGTETSRECRTSAEDAVHRDDLVIDASGRYSVSISTTNEQPWAVTVTELPPD
ncbi:hypothetical protein CLV85_1657 [Salinibacterium amurskyense]|uniref:Secreted protein n=1 Tax=Salinibacterium amurskyense TaxID=205941 RepID=A0A2M9D9N9_9MICO|nr:hypothetical protein [Salinibacterium amurskyense]PJJ82456.1 hypothetical protein CLV85_1657 [Salinibacterium amurskyense]RLQ82204.1 hypothetical protein D9C83_08245 [Salinibacterium amurskyense]GHD76891.1 hypothetical protein GCM10007394_01730 [Salinibacterium amurskyense]